MNFGSLQSAARPHYYDRSPTVIALSYANQLAPNPSVQRWAYTVPSNKAAFVELAHISLTRETAAGPVGQVLCYQAVTFPAASAVNWLWIDYLDNTIGVPKTLAAGSAGYMPAGTVWNSFTSDLSTGGITTFITTGKGVEFYA